MSVNKASPFYIVSREIAEALQAADLLEPLSLPTPAVIVWQGERRRTGLIKIKRRLTLYRPQQPLDHVPKKFKRDPTHKPAPVVRRPPAPEAPGLAALFEAQMAEARKTPPRIAARPPQPAPLAPMAQAKPAPRHVCASPDAHRRTGQVSGNMCFACNAPIA